ncbi:hypothetical protein KUTeg_006430 [Tegillarca granosa]|uniref:Tetraspanin n=1 Tax=Tegillarca granosa TaxID=220873 RepID=A0ABQ9FGG9_TEGGR|nr:hypothetical protein KUTeg_006430 [Tegillarca granosa]
MGACLTCGRICLVIINILFLILGLIFFVVGMLVRFGDSVLKQYYQPVLNSLESSLNNSGYINVDFSSFSLSDLVGGLAIFLIVFGVILLIITFLGCCGACIKQQVLLVIYAIVVIVILAGELVFVGILYGKPELVQDQIKNPLKTAINSDFMGFNGTNIVSLGWNFAHQQIKCCGVDGYNDFDNATIWLRDYGAPIGTLQTPVTCCKTLPTDTTDYSCATMPTASTNYLNTGCFDEVWNLCMGNVALVGGCIAGFGVIQLVLIIFAFAIFWDARKNNKVGTDI